MAESDNLNAPVESEFEDASDYYTDAELEEMEEKIKPLLIDDKFKNDLKNVMVPRWPDLAENLIDALQNIASIIDTLEHDDDVKGRGAGTFALEKLEEYTRKSLIKRVEDQDANVQLQASYALSRLFSPTAAGIGQVLTCLTSLVQHHPDADVRMRAAGLFGLVTFRGGGSSTWEHLILPDLVRAVESNDNPEALPALYKAIKEIKGFGGDLFVKDLQEKIKNGTPIDYEALTTRKRSVPESEKYDVPKHLDAAIAMAAVPRDAPYEEKAEKLAGLTHEVRQRIAAELAPALNARIQAMPHDTYEQKKELAGWVNAELEPLGLAVREPKTGLPAKLRAKTGNWPGVGSFAIEVYHDGKQKTPTVSDKLPELTLIDARPPKEPEVKWQQAVGPKASRRGRKLS